MKTALLSSSVLLAAGLLVALPASAAGTAGIPRPAVPDAAATWVVDPVHSSVQFRIKHLDASYLYGRFDAVSGVIVLDPDKLEASSVQFSVETASINTNSKDRDDHLRGPDFFNAKVNPKISFESTKITREAKDRYQVTGKLKLNGKEKEITVSAVAVGTGKNMQGGEVAGFEASFSIKRSEFGISIYPGALGEDVALTVAIEAGKKA